MERFCEIAHRRRKYSVLLAPLAAICGLSLYIAAAFLPLKALWQLCSLAFFAAAVLLFARHAVEYTYFIQISPDDGLLELGVRQRKGRRTGTLCRLLLSDLCTVEHCTPERKKVCREQFRTDTVHSYCPDVFPRETVYLVFNEQGTRIVLRLQPSQALLDILKQYQHE